MRIAGMTLGRLGALAGMALASIMAAPPASASTATTPPAQTTCTTGARGPLAPTPPPSDPFYTAPAPLPSVSPGTVIRSEPVCIANLEIPMPYAAWLVMYMSSGAEDSSGQPSDYNAVPMATTALIIAPLTQSSQARPLVAYQNAEDDDSMLYAPSYVEREGSSADTAAIQPLLAQGVEVVFSDYEGPASADGAGQMAGHAVLDAIRAAENLSATDGLEGDQTPVGLWGYSGGAFATGWASELAPGYAPELRIAAIAEGGVPADLKEVVDNLNTSISPSLDFIVAVGGNAGYPNLLQWSLFNQAGQQLATQFRSTGDTSYPSSTDSLSDFTVCGCNPVDEPAQFPAVAELIRDDSLGRHIPTAPMYIYQAVNDELIPFDQVERLVSTYCQAGATVDFRAYIAQEHITAAVSGAPEAIAYLTARLGGAPPVSTCGLPGNGIGVPPSLVPDPPLPPSSYQLAAAVPEAPLVVSIPFLGLAMAGGLVWRRQRARRPT